MNLYLLRHTSVNIDSGICYGQTNVETSISFPKEVDTIVKKLKAVDFKRIYSSPLIRCIKLANIFSNDTIIDNRLVEMNFGSWEMQSWDKIYQTEYSKRWFADYVNTPTPNGESYRDLINRVTTFTNTLKQEVINGNVLIVTHAGVIRALHSIVNNMEPEKTFDIKIAYGQVSVIDL